MSIAFAKRSKAEGNNVKQSQTQGERLLSRLRRRGYTTMELLQLGISCAPWKRLAESKHKLKPGEQIKKTKRADGLCVYRVTKA